MIDPIMQFLNIFHASNSGNKAYCYVKLTAVYPVSLLYHGKIALCCLMPVYVALKTLMDPDQFLSVLFRLTSDLREDDLKLMKFLVSGSGGVARQQLEHASRNKFMLILKELNMITSHDMSFFCELLSEVDQRDLCQKVIHAFPGTQISSRIPEVRALMFHIAQSMTEQDLRNLCFHFDVYDEDVDAIQLMELFETREPVESTEELAEASKKFGLSHLFDKAMRIKRAGINTSKDKDFRSRLRISRPMGNSRLKESRKESPSVRRSVSLCDQTGCCEGCLYRTLWMDKFPHQSVPMPVFKSERLLSHDDVSTDGRSATEELLGEGGFGCVYKGL